LEAKEEDYQVMEVDKREKMMRIFNPGIGRRLRSRSGRRVDKLVGRTVKIIQERYE
jgi:hypothetical protein